MILCDPDTSFYDMLQESSGGADLIFMGMATPTEVEDFQSYYHDLQQKTTNLPSTVFVLAAQEMAFREVLA